MKLQGKGIIVPALLFLGILVVAVNALLAFRSIDILIDGENWVQHTWAVIAEIEDVMGSAKDAETGNRGFLITGEDVYLQPYTAALNDLPQQLDQLRTLTDDNPVQQRSIIEMRAVMDQRLALLQQGINLRRSGRDMSLEAMVLSGTGKLQMDHLRSLADRMVGEERRLLILRTAQTRSSTVRARATIGIASFIDFLLIVMMFRYFAGERALRLASEETAAKLAVSRLEVEAKAAEVNALNRTLEERVQLRTAELEATNRELEAFSYSVSHDLRAPLRTIDGFSLALEEDYTEAVDATGRDYIKRVRTGVQRMGELIDALLQLSRITRASITREHFNLSDLAKSVAANLLDENGDRHLLFQIEDGLTADADPKLIRVALENLLGNAVKFSGRVSDAVVDFGWDASQKAWYVRDNGAGFDMHYADKLFNAFNRLHGDKDFKGSGIGLATVARVVRRHHGTIWADSVVDHGATFWFTLG